MLAAGALLSCSGGGASVPDDGVSALDRDTAAIRSATQDFRSLDAAVAAGYPREVRRCLSHPEEGGMGYHHVNRALLDDTLELARPEILLYSRTPEGEYRFNGVEYIVPYSARPPDAEPPTIMDHELKRSAPLELWYLHAWVWTENPNGLFADWNPQVECPAVPTG
jgi:hypothetical protein